MIVLAVDPSLRSTGLAQWGRPLVGVSNVGAALWRDIHVATLKCPSKHRGVARLAWYRARFVELFIHADLIMCEGYAYHAKGRAAVSLGELGGVLRLTAQDSGAPLVEVPPATVKKLATGKGNAPKEAVLVAAVRRLQYPGASHDEADALWLLEAALQRHHPDIAVQLPKSHNDALASIPWGNA